MNIIDDYLELSKRVMNTQWEVVDLDSVQQFVVDRVVKQESLSINPSTMKALRLALRSSQRPCEAV